MSTLEAGAGPGAAARAAPWAGAALRADLERCIRCGLCLPSCPTYEVTRTEMDGPRGRIVLLDAVASASADGRAAPGATAALRLHLDRCLGCRACEAACPSGVPYGRLFEAGRAALAASRPPGWAARVALGALGRRRTLRAAARLAGLAPRAALRAAARRLPLPAGLRVMAELAPPRPGAFVRLGATYPALGTRRGAVALFLGCVQDAFLPSVHAATVRVLQRAGWEVRVPTGQTCCGAAARHAGLSALADDWARRNAAAFAPCLHDPELAAVIVNAGGCLAALAEPPAEGRAPGAAALADRVVDAASFLAARGLVVPLGPLPGRVALVDSCHLRHVVGVADAPRDLLAAVPALEPVELARPDACCGSAGVYNVGQPALADAVLDAKLDEVAAAAPTVLAVCNPGCQLQMARGVRRRGMAVEVAHLVQLLDRAQAAAGGPPPPGPRPGPRRR